MKKVETNSEMTKTTITIKTEAVAWRKKLRVATRPARKK